MPNESAPFDLIIVGGGIAGSAAALRAAQYQLKALWIRGNRVDANRSRGQWVVDVDNMIGTHDGIIRKKVGKLFKRGDEFEAAREKLAETPHMPISTRDIIGNVVDRIEADYGQFITMVKETCSDARALDTGELELVVTDKEGVEQTYRSAHVVLATGAMDRQPLVLKDTPKGVVDNIKWIYPAANREQVLYCIRCEGHLTRQTRTAIIGSSESAAQLAMMLHERYGSTCAVLTNGEQPAWKQRTHELLQAYGIPIYSSRIVHLDSRRDGLHQIQLEDETAIDMRFAMISMGLYRVYNDLAVALGAALGNEGAPTEERHVLIDSKGATSVPGLFAIGDMTTRADEPVMKQIYTCQEYAVRAIDTIDRARREVMRSAALLRHSAQ
ncbi:MAG: thioredoxin reductase (NADPH) [Planctomycetota bacterium]|jgi:thioredoxin reductase (NADPH)